MEDHREGRRRLALAFDITAQTDHWEGGVGISVLRSTRDRFLTPSPTTIRSSGYFRVGGDVTLPDAVVLGKNHA